MRSVVFFICLSSTAWALDRDLSLREGEQRTFKLPGVAQVAIDDASVVEGTGKGDQLTLAARRPGNARVLVLLKTDQWVTFKVKVLAGDVAEGPLAEALPADGEPVRLRVGESRVFDTPGIAKLPGPGRELEVKVNGKVLELKGVAPGRAVVDVTLQGGKRVALNVVVEGERLALQAKRSEAGRGERVEVPLSGEVLLKAPDLEAVQVEDDEVAEVRIVGEGRVVVRGLQEGETFVNVRRGGKVFSHAVSVVGSGGGY
ncbi:MAG: pilus assembly protein N-terminal domain-containing protein [Myxococcaceae bacterium]|nr:pilus assembly protein N-terminal domain-containing protein [Myxococcaceae bacterium]